jgi:hypothetical protein
MDKGYWIVGALWVGILLAIWHFGKFAGRELAMICVAAVAAVWMWNAFLGNGTISSTVASTVGSTDETILVA